MPVQALIRRLSRTQIEKMIADAKVGITLTDHDGLLLVVVTNQAEGGDLAANKLLQAIADADATILHHERTAREAAEQAARDKEKAAAKARAAATAATASKTDTPS